MKLQQYYETQTALLRLERRSAELVEERKRAKYDLRCSEEALLNYQGSVRSFLDKLSGRREEREETLCRLVRNAEAALKELQREQESLNQKRKELKQVLESLPSSEALRAEEEQTWASLEAEFCAEALKPLLEDNYRALLEYRSLMQGSRMEILTIEKQQEIYAEPNVRAELCKPYLLRMKEVMGIQGKSFEIGAYYESPVSYLVNVVAKHNRLDRVNQALNQVETIQRAICNL